MTTLLSLACAKVATHTVAEAGKGTSATKWLGPVVLHCIALTKTSNQDKDNHKDSVSKTKERDQSEVSHHHTRLEAYVMRLSIACQPVLLTLTRNSQSMCI